MTSNSLLTIGRLAAEAGVHVETIRYYQRRGLLAEPPKPDGGAQRRYPRAAVRRVRFVKRAQALGFTLDEVGALLQLDEAGACAATRERATAKLQTIDAKLADLRAMRQSLAALLRRCDAADGDGACPLIDALAAD